MEVGKQTTQIDCKQWKISEFYQKQLKTHIFDLEGLKIAEERKKPEKKKAFEN